jgi:hypothetical protein
MAWLAPGSEVTADGNGVGVQTSRWLIEHLLEAEHDGSVMRSIRYQMHSAKFPGAPRSGRLRLHAIQSGSGSDRRTGDAEPLRTGAQRGVHRWHRDRQDASGDRARCLRHHHGKRVRFFSTVDLVNLLEQEKAAGKAGRLAFSLLRMWIW